MEKSGFLIFLYPDSDPDQSKLRSKLDKDPSSDFFHEGPKSSICVILLTNKQTDKSTVMKIIPP